MDELGQDGPLPLERMASLLGLTATLNARTSVHEILDAVLHVLMRELQAAWSGAYAREGGRDRLEASRGPMPDLPAVVTELGSFAADAIVRRDSGDRPAAFESLGAEVLCPIRKGGRTLAVLALGPRADGRAYRPEDAGFLRSVAACAAAAVENGIAHEELRRLSERLSVKEFQLGNLLDVGRELTASLDETNIQSRVTTTLMGHLLVSRCALYLDGPEGLRLAHERGVPSRVDRPVIPAREAEPVLKGLNGPRQVGELPAGPVRDRLQRTRMAVVVPLGGVDRACGFLAAGERASGAPFTDEDFEFAAALGRQCIGALDTARLHRIRVEKERQDRELQIAREIQRGLLPKRCPEARGFEFAAETEPCHEVGGDFYDLFPLDHGRLAVAVADVSGKGTPAGILMASVHASLRALAGTAALDVVLGRLSRFLFESTQAGRYVTLFYGELDLASRRLRYVSAGHVPPYRLGRGGRRERLHVGGPALGLMGEAGFTVCEITLDPGDVLTVVTDGATEATSPEDVEFGDEGVFRVLESQAGGTAAEALRGLLDAVHAWTAPAACPDDLTALVVKALEA